MVQWSKERIQVTGILILFFLLSLFSYPILANNNAVQLYTSILFILIVVLAFITGTVSGLFATLLYIFIFGSTLFFVHLTETERFPLLADFSVTTFFILSVILLLTVLLAGSLHNIVKMYDQEQSELRDRINESLTIDLATGFDSKGRFMADLKSELSRAARYNEPLSLVMVELDYFTQFRKLYGEKESVRMITSLASTMQDVMRLSDRKYRLNDQRFVLLLPHTNEDGTGVVLMKLKEALMNYKLLNEHTVTLFYHVSTFTFEGVPITEEEIMALMESELKSGAL